MIPGPRKRSALRSIMILLTQTLGIRFLLALIAAIGLWIYLTEQTSGLKTATAPLVTVEITGVPSDLIVVPQPNQATPPTVQVTAMVPPDQVNKVSASWFQATIDVSGSTEPGTKTYPVVVKPLQPGVNPQSVTPSVLPVTLEREAQRDMPITPVYQGQLPPGYTYSPPVFDTQTVTVRGPESVLQKVASVIAVIRLDNAKSSFQSTVSLIPQNSQAGDISDPLLQLNPKAVHVSVAIQPAQTTRTVAVLPQVTGQPAEGYVVAGVSVNPIQVLLVGDASALDTLNNITTAPVDVSGITGSITKSAALQPPKNISVAGNQSVQVTVQVQPLLASELMAVAPTVVGVPAGAQVQLSDSSVSVSLQAPSQTLKSLQPKDISVVLDVSGLGSGAHDLAPTVTAPAGVTVLGVTPNKVTVTLVPPTPTPTHTPTPTPTATPIPSATPTPKPSPTPGPNATRVSARAPAATQEKPAG